MTSTPNPVPAKEYLGDGAYAFFDGFGVWLTAENGVTTTDKIYMEPPVMLALLRLLGRHYDTSVLAKALEAGA